MEVKKGTIKGAIKGTIKGKKNRVVRLYKGEHDWNTVFLAEGYLIETCYIKENNYSAAYLCFGNDLLVVIRDIIKFTIYDEEDLYEKEIIFIENGGVI